MPERIDQLNEGLRQLATATHEVSTEVARSVNVELEKSRRVVRWGFAAVSVLLIPSLIAAVTSTILLLQSRQRGLQNREVLNQITDCTTPGRPCYDAGQKRTATVLQKVVLSEIVVAQCARTTTTDSDLTRCVNVKLTEQAKAAS